MKFEKNHYLCLLFTSASVFGFWMISTPIISTALIGLNLQIIFGAPLLACAVSALLFYFFEKPLNHQKLLPVIQQLTVFSVPLALFLFTQAQATLDASFAEPIAKNPNIFVVSHIMWAASNIHHLYFIFALALPFIFYGSYITLCFQRKDKGNITKTYFFELVGFFLGLLLSAFILDYTSLQTVYTAIFLSGLLASYLLLTRRQLLFSAPIFCIIIAAAWYKPYTFETKRNLNWSSRDFKNELEVSEEGRSWTTYAKVQKLRTGRWTSVSIADGTGYAAIPYKNLVLDRVPHTLTNYFQPQKTLVLFAGAGLDLQTLAERSNYEMDITGLEINPRVIQAGIEQEGGDLKNLLARKNIRLLNIEGRRFLEQTKQSYDAILYSWSGSSYTHHAGINLATTQYTFTNESLATVTKNLNPQGVFIISGNSKPSLIFSLFKATENKPNFNLKNSLVLVSNNKTPKDHWTYYSEDSFLIFKNGEFTLKEVNDLRALVQKNGYYISMSPFTTYTEPKYSLMNEVLEKKNHQLGLAYFNQKSKNKFFIMSDNKPFFNGGRIKNKYNFNFAKKNFERGKNKLKLNGVRKNLLREFISFFCLFFSLLLCLYSLLKFENKSVAYSNASNAFLGFFSSAFIVLMTYKFILYFGNPSLSIVLSQSTALIAGGVGAYFVQKRALIFQKRSFFFSAALFLSYLLVVLTLNSSTTSKVFFVEGFGLILLIAFVFPVSFFTSAFFSTNLISLKKANQKSISLGLAINVLGSAAAAFSAPAVVEASGLRFCFYLILLALCFSLGFYSLKNRYLRTLK